jgi:hypothetical protein
VGNHGADGALLVPMLIPQTALDPRSVTAKLFSPAALPDKRLWVRLHLMVTLLFARFEQALTIVPRAERRGMQRFCNNERVVAKRLAEHSTHQTIEAMRTMERAVLAHDTTEVDKVGHAEPDDAGPLRSNAARGYLVHACTVVDPVTGSRIGMLTHRAWTRSWELHKDDHASRPFEDKESSKWIRGIKDAVQAAQRAGLQSELWHVMDREGDVHENFAFAQRHHHSVIVRATSDRLVQSEHRNLWAHLAAQPERLQWNHQVPTKVTTQARKDAKKAGHQAQRRLRREEIALGRVRTATLSLRTATVTLTPKKKTSGKPVTVNVVWVCEVDPPWFVEPLEWMLLTTCPIDTVDQAYSIVDAYCARWGSEDLHKILKTGLHLEEDAVDSIESFRRQLAIVLPLATHVAQWTYAARESPTEPIGKYVTSDCLEVMSHALTFYKLPVARRPRTLGELVTRLAQLGGYEVRPDRVPGWLVIWRGWRRLLEFWEMYEFASRRIRNAPD